MFHLISLYLSFDSELKLWIKKGYLCGQCLIINFYVSIFYQIQIKWNKQKTMNWYLLSLISSPVIFNFSLEGKHWIITWSIKIIITVLLLNWSWTYSYGISCNIQRHLEVLLYYAPRRERKGERDITLFVADFLWRNWKTSIYCSNNALIDYHTYTSRTFSIIACGQHSYI